MFKIILSLSNFCQIMIFTAAPHLQYIKLLWIPLLIITTYVWKSPGRIFSRIKCWCYSRFLDSLQYKQISGTLMKCSLQYLANAAVKSIHFWVTSESSRMSRVSHRKHFLKNFLSCCYYSIDCMYYVSFQYMLSSFIILIIVSWKYRGSNAYFIVLHDPFLCNIVVSVFKNYILHDRRW